MKEEEVFDIIDAQHKEKGHNGRIINLKQMGEQYANITQTLVETYIYNMIHLYNSNHT